MRENSEYVCMLQVVLERMITASELPKKYPVSDRKPGEIL
jgi:hypothetical protein